MKIDKKGFATSTIIFGLLSVFLIAISVLLLTLNSTTGLNKSLNEKTIENMEYGSSSLNELEERITELENQTSNMVDKIYPVGSVYISITDDTVEKVKERFGGEWEKYSEGTALVGIGSYTDSNGNVTSYSSDSKGGSNIITLTESNLPSHTHTYTPKGTIKSTFTGSEVSTNSAGAHTHNELHLANLDGNALGWSGILGSYSNVKSSSNGAHTHTVTAAGTVSSTFTGTAGTTDSTGSGTSFSIQNPYTAVYIYKRVK